MYGNLFVNTRISTNLRNKLQEYTQSLDKITQKYERIHSFTKRTVRSFRKFEVRDAPAHTSAIVTAFLKKEKVTVLPHPLYSPDLVPCDFFLFPKLKAFLAGRKYQSRQALGSDIHQYLITVQHSCQVTLNSVQRFLTRRFLKFFI